MEEVRKKIAIIGPRGQAMAMKVLIEARRPDVDVECITPEEHEESRIAAGNRIHTIILDEVDQPRDKTRIALVGHAVNMMQSLGRHIACVEAEPDHRDLIASARYQKPPRLRGAANQKRQAQKSKNRRRK